ncbi:MAG: hypothetical protein AAF483_15840 [Planctomycetota bacterium]
MEIKRLLVSQRKLRNVLQIEEMIVEIENGGCLPRIEIWRDSFGVCQVSDGHHRLVAYWLSGRRVLEHSEYLLIESDSVRARFGGVACLILRCMQTSESF